MPIMEAQDVLARLDGSPLLVFEPGDVVLSRGQQLRPAAVPQARRGRRGDGRGRSDPGRPAGRGVRRGRPPARHGPYRQRAGGAVVELLTSSRTPPRSSRPSRSWRCTSRRCWPGASMRSIIWWSRPRRRALASGQRRGLVGEMIERLARALQMPRAAGIARRPHRCSSARSRSRASSATATSFCLRSSASDEIALLRAAAARIYASARPEVVREKDGTTARTAFAVAYLQRAVPPPRRPSAAGAARSSSCSAARCYIHQFKINAKAAFDGDVWQWHQDYGTWSRDDLMPEPRAMNIALFLDEVTEFNGPLMFIPGSHRQGVLAAGHDVATTSYPLWTLDHATVRALAERGGLVAPKGPAGSVLMFHCNLVHASPGNVSPYDRSIVYVSLCEVDQPHPPVQAAGMDRAPRLHPDRAARRRLPGRADRGSSRGGVRSCWRGQRLQADAAGDPGR